MMITEMMMVAAGTGMDGIIDSGKSILTWLQRGGIISAAIGFGIGAYLLIWGGPRGRMNCVPWFVGGAVGLVILMGAEQIAEGIDSNIQFDLILPLLLLNSSNRKR
jgi:hypothetical protein